MPSRRLLAAAAATALLGGSLAVAHALSPTAQSRPEPAAKGDAQRFLELTGGLDGQPPAVPGEAEERGAGAAAAPPRPRAARAGPRPRRLASRPASAGLVRLVCSSSRP
jgi:hypothetical protein